MVSNWLLLSWPGHVLTHLSTRLSVIAAEFIPKSSERLVAAKNLMHIPHVFSQRHMEKKYILRSRTLLLDVGQLSVATERFLSVLLVAYTLISHIMRWNGKKLKHLKPPGHHFLELQMVRCHFNKNCSKVDSAPLLTSHVQPEAPRPGGKATNDNITSKALVRHLLL